MRGVILSAVLLLVAMPLVAESAELEGAGEELRLLSSSHAHTDGPLLAGIEMKLAPGWHTYWRYPGASGIAPRFDWAGSRNVASVDLLWPVPRQFDEGGEATYGYDGEIVWPVLVRARDAKLPVVLKVAVSYGVCREICVPGEAEISRTIAVDEKDAADQGEKIRRYLAKVPSAPRDPAMVAARFIHGDEPQLEVRFGGAGETPILIVEGPGTVSFGAQKISKADGSTIYRMPVEAEPGETLKSAELRLTFAGPGTAIEALRRVD